MCVHLCTQLMEKRLRYTSTSAQVQQHLMDPGAGLPDLPSVAARMHTSERTLRRRLQADGVSFAELLRQARQGLAETLLRSTDMPLVEIAERVGYSDLSGFSQAFKRWTGLPPVCPAEPHKQVPNRTGSINPNLGSI
jgi:AraC-like DNA-binding protein